MYDEIIKTIKLYEENGDFTYPNVDDKTILRAEKELNVKLPDQYCWFLKQYGHGGINGIETYGIGKNGKTIFVDKTLQFRVYGLENDKIVIENCDEWIYCLDEKSGTVVMWSQYDKNCKTVYKDFLDYLNDRIGDAIENM